MKKLFFYLALGMFVLACKQTPLNTSYVLRDGFYLATKTDTSETRLRSALDKGQVILDFDRAFKPGEATRVIVDTTDYVALDLNNTTVQVGERDEHKTLSISFPSSVAEHIKSFTEKHLQQNAVIVLDGKALTMQEIRSAITGNGMEISGCDAQACDYLLAKMKQRTN